jgi:hypothetical protein
MSSLVSASNGAESTARAAARRDAHCASSSSAARLAAWLADSRSAATAAASPQAESD